MVKTSNPLQRIMDEIKTWARINSPWIIHYNSGSCNGCDIEILATLTPRYDVERFGIKLQGSPRHADVLVCTGPVTLQSRDRLVRIYLYRSGYLAITRSISQDLRTNARAKICCGSWLLRTFGRRFSGML